MPGTILEFWDSESYFSICVVRSSSPLYFVNHHAEETYLHGSEANAKKWNKLPAQSGAWIAHISKWSIDLHWILD